MMSDLLPCPFCGGEIGVELIDEGGGTIYHYGLKPKNEVICVLGGRSYSMETWNIRLGADRARADGIQECIKALNHVPWHYGQVVGINDAIAAVKELVADEAEKA